MNRVTTEAQQLLRWLEDLESLDIDYDVKRRKITRGEYYEMLGLPKLSENEQGDHLAVYQVSIINYHKRTKNKE